LVGDTVDGELVAWLGGARGVQAWTISSAKRSELMPG
jgi:hypothetical protein